MFDPMKLELTLDDEEVKVLEFVENNEKVRKMQLSLEGEILGLIMKNNYLNEYDQILSDRIKYLFGLKPLHTFGFDYEGGNYICFCDQNLEHWNKNPIELESEKFQVEMCKILLFRFVIGARKTNEDHIMIRKDGLPTSISEMQIASYYPDENFLRRFVNVDIDQFILARNEISKHFNYDNLRGIVCQKGQWKRDFKGVRLKHKTNKTSAEILSVIEDRYDIIMSCDVEEILVKMLSPATDEEMFEQFLIS